MLILLMSCSKGDLNTQGNGLLRNRKIGYVETNSQRKPLTFSRLLNCFPREMTSRSGKWGVRHFYRKLTLHEIKILEINAT